MRQTVRKLKLRQMLLAALLFGALSGAFSSSGTFTQTAFSQNYGSGQGNCRDQYPDMTTWCAPFACYYTIAGGPSSAKCKYMRNSGSGTCPTHISCKP